MHGTIPQHTPHRLCQASEHAAMHMPVWLLGNLVRTSCFLLLPGSGMQRQHLPGTAWIACIPIDDGLTSTLRVHSRPPVLGHSSTLRKKRKVTRRLMVLRASRSPVKKAPQSTDTAEGPLTSCATKSSAVITDTYACVETTLRSCEVQGRSWIPITMCGVAKGVKGRAVVYCGWRM